VVRDEGEKTMPRKRSAREEAETSKPRQLRKRLRKAEDQLADAVLKRDRAQARVEALSIIADETRAQLAEADKAVELEGVVEQGSERGAVRRHVEGERPSTEGKGEMSRVLRTEALQHREERRDTLARETLDDRP
jgi:hypothetical protein